MGTFVRRVPALHVTLACSRALICRSSDPAARKLPEKTAVYALNDFTDRSPV